MRSQAIAMLFATALLGAQEPTAPAAAPTYDPLAVPDTALPPSLALNAHDGKRQRDLPLRVFLPAAKAPAPLILFSHGLGGTRDTCNYLGVHWSRRGYAVVFVQHPGSDDSVWKNAPLRERMAAMQQAASAQNLDARCLDVPAVLDQLAVWNQQEDHPCQARFDLDHVGMSGHSFGAITTQMVAGENVPLLGQKYTDLRIDAAIAMSPSSPKAMDGKRAFGDVRVPWLLMTGTADVSPIGQQDAASRQRVYPCLPRGIDRGELVLDGAEHSAFTERGLPGDGQQRNPNHHRAILALSTAFWDAQLRGDAAARAWLYGDGPRSVLEPKDRWQAAAAEAKTK
jgi:predicted dienelactone hydrolase